MAQYASHTKPAKGKILFFELLMNFIYIILYLSSFFTSYHHSFFICQISNKTKCFQCQFLISIQFLSLQQWIFCCCCCCFCCCVHEHNLSSFHRESIFPSILFICDVTDQLNLALIELPFESRRLL